MKKSLFLFATAALVLAACSSEDDIVQSAPQKAESQANAVMFDTYTSSATRAGDPAGVMTTDKLKTADKGFGVFAMYQDAVDYPANNTTLLPNFMFNEHVSWSGGWTYSPLKYWPNETTNDSQDPAAVMPGPGTPGANLDKLSFFAYAPYVVTGEAPLATKDATTMVIDRSGGTKISAYHGSETSGITAISAQDYASDPKVEWAYSADLDQNVDLLWGVAPAGMSYTDVSGSTTSVDVGMPLLDMVKPDKDQKMKFLFQHALSRIGLSVVSAIDQIAAGDDGNKFNNMQTRVLIKSVEVYGDFGKQGVLNLNNGTSNVANWIAASIDQHNVGGAALFTFDSRQDGSSGNGYIAPDLRYVDSQITGVTGAGSAGAAATAFAALNTGVLPSEQTLLSGDADPSKKVTDPAFEVGTVYYKALTAPDKGYAIATTSATNAVDAYELTGTYNADGSKFTRVFKTDAGSKATVSGLTPQLYNLTFSAEKTASTTNINAADVYYTKEDEVYTYHKAAALINDDTKYYTLETKTDLAVDAYDAGDYYTALIPRYFMVIPTGDTNIKVKITYAVVTYDEKLKTYVTNVENAITKATSLTLENGKSYNLKLILGLTSVKLDATVADWQVADDTEIWLPKNND